MSFGLWDFILIGVVSIQAGILSYISDPKKKSLVLVFPFPFTIATISLGTQVNATHVLGLIDLAIFTYGVRFLHSKVKLNIIFSIIFCAAIYCIIGLYLARILPDTEILFWISVILVLFVAIMLALFTQRPYENPYRTDLPVYIKLPIIIGVVSILIVLKKYLQGFMTVFPMVGVIAAYEGRFMLASICRQIPTLMISLVSLMMTIRVLSNIVPFYWSIVFGWMVFLSVLWFLSSFLWEVSLYGKRG